MGLSGGAIAGIVIGSCVVAIGILVVMFWVMSGSKHSSKTKKQQSTVSEEGAERRSSRLGKSVSMADGKDHFFSNLVPSFIKRDTTAAT